MRIKDRPGLCSVSLGDGKSLDQHCPTEIQGQPHTEFHISHITALKQTSEINFNNILNAIYPNYHFKVINIKKLTHHSHSFFCTKFSKPTVFYTHGTTQFGLATFQELKSQYIRQPTSRSFPYWIYRLTWRWNKPPPAKSLFIWQRKVCQAPYSAVWWPGVGGGTTSSRHI